LPFFIMKIIIVILGASIKLHYRHFRCKYQMIPIIITSRIPSTREVELETWTPVAFGGAINQFALTS